MTIIPHHTQPGIVILTWKAEQDLVFKEMFYVISGMYGKHYVCGRSKKKHLCVLYIFITGHSYKNHNVISGFEWVEKTF